VSDEIANQSSQPKVRYSHGHEPSALASHATRTAANSTAYLLPHLRGGQNVLDVGCGPGTITLDLAELVAPGQVVGVENTEAPLVAARENAASRGDSRTRFELADAVALSYPDASFDIVHAHQVLQHLADPVAALREMGRVCRPGGWIAVRDADYAAMTWYPDSPDLEQWRTTYREIAHRNGANPDAGRRLRSWANQAGITDIQITSSTWTYADPASCRWWGNGQAARVEAAAFSTQAAELGLARTDVKAIADGWRTWGESSDAWFVILHGELLAKRQ
jgi:ubiquinone/menaquinone biosynthesis C-methylase UbiE